VTAPPKRLSDVAPTTAAPSAAAPTRTAAPAAPPTSAAAAPPAKIPRAAAAPAVVPAPAPVDAPSAAAEPGVELDQFVSMWPAVLDALSSFGRVAWLLFQPSSPLSISSGTLAVAVSDVGKVKNIKASGHDERLRQAILDVMRTDVRIDVVPDPERAAAGPQPATASASSRPAAKAPAPPPAEADDPSLDDDNADSAVGVDLALRELGATQIGEIDH
jgi:hypothetical protein